MRTVLIAEAPFVATGAFSPADDDDDHHHHTAHLQPSHTAYALRLRDGYGPRQKAKGAKIRRDCDGWLETAADDAVMAIQLALLLVIRNIHCTPRNRPSCPCERCLEPAQPVSTSCERAPMQAGLRACTLRRVYLGAPWSTNITVRLRSRWDAEAGSCRREYVHHVALPSSGSFFLEEPRLFSHKGFLRGCGGFDTPGSKSRAAGSRPPVVSCLTLPFLSLPFTHCVHSSALNAAALIITSQARTAHRPGRAQGVSRR
jgi:hypothetical protein